MRLRIQNTIQMDGQTEYMDQTYQAEKTEKAGSTFLIYHNEEGEKVVLKFNPTDFVMTRFSDPTSIMRFIKDKEILISIHTPVGIQQLLTDTSFYELNLEEGSLQVDYRLKTADGQQVFATYQLQLTWQEG